MTERTSARPNKGARGGDGRFVRTPEVAERDAEALRLRSRGRTYQQIADALYGGSRGEAHNAVSRALRETVAEPAEELRTLELERLDRLIRAVEEVLERQPDDGPVLQAVDRLQRLSESRRKLLGLDAPAQVKIDGKIANYKIAADVEKL